MLASRNCSRSCALLFALAIGACATDEIEDLGSVDDGKGDTALPRSVTIDLEPGERKQFRITTAAFVARLEQAGDVDAQLTAKHYDLFHESETSATPELLATGDGTSRRWTLTVYNRGDATLVVDAPAARGELAVVSDIDKTILPPETAAGMPPPYPGTATLFSVLEAETPGDVYYVTARSPDRIVELPDWLAMYGFPAGAFETGVSGLPWIVQPEKIADITRLFEETGNQRYVLVGDTTQRDPEVYNAIRTKYPERVASIIIHKTNVTVNPARVVGMHLVDNYAEAAALVFGDGLITEAQARDVINAARTEGLALTDAEIDALIDAAR